MPINSFYPSTLSFLLTQLLGERQTSKIKPVNKEGNPLSCFLSKGKKKTLSKDDEETTAKVTMTKRKGNNNQRQG